MIVVKIFLVVAFAAAGVLLALSNPGSTEVDYLVGQTQVPTAWLVVGSVTAGALVGAGITGVAVLHWRLRARRWRRKAEEAEQALGQLRNSTAQGA